MEAVRNRQAYADQLAKSLSTDKKNTGMLTGAIADSLAAGMQTRDMDAVAAQLQIQTRQQTRNKAENDALAVQTMQTARTMSRMGIQSSDVSANLCRALQNHNSVKEINRLHQKMEDRKAGSMNDGNKDNDGKSSPGNAGAGGSGAGGSGGGNSGGGGSGAGGSSGGGSGGRK